MWLQIALFQRRKKNRERKKNPNRADSWPPARIEMRKRDAPRQENEGGRPAFSSGESPLLLSGGIKNARCSLKQSAAQEHVQVCATHSATSASNFTISLHDIPMGGGEGERVCVCVGGGGGVSRLGVSRLHSWWDSRLSWLPLFYLHNQLCRCLRFQHWLWLRCSHGISCCRIWCLGISR